MGPRRCDDIRRTHLGLLLPKASRYRRPSSRYIYLTLYHRTYTRQSVTLATDIDIYSKEYPARVWLMVVFGLLDSMWQTYAYWLMGAMSNSLSKLAVFTGFCK